MIKKRLVGLIVLSIFLMTISTLNSNAHEGHNDAFSKTNTNQVEKIQITKEGEEAIGIETEAVKLSSFDKTIQATGQVEATDKGYFDLSSPISGMVKNVFVKEGDRVNQWQTLATIQSIEAANLLRDLLNQKASLEKDTAILNKELEINKITLEREEALLKEGISSKKDFLNAQRAYQNSQASLEASKKQLSLVISTTKNQLSIMGMPESALGEAFSSENINSTISIRAPITGIVSFRNLTPGENIQPDKKIFSIVNLSPIWIMLDIHQEQVPFIKLGLAVKIKSSSEEEIKGKVSSIGATIDPEKRTLPVRVISDNSQESLKPGMTVTAEIVYGQSEKASIVIPGSAIMEDDGRDYVYVKYDDFYQPVFIKAGQKSASKVEVSEGLYEGDNIVVRGSRQLQAHALLNQNDSQKHSPGAKSNFNWLFLGIFLLVSFGSFLFFKSKKKVEV